MNMMRQPRQPNTTTAASLCLALLLTAVVLASVGSAKHHHGGSNRREGDGRRGRDRGGGGGSEEGSGHHQEKDNVISRPGKLTSRSDRRNVLLHEAVRKLLGFESSPSPRRRQGRALLPDPRRPPPMPKYVLDLYEKYRSGEMREGPSLGNTVRSIPAEIGELTSVCVCVCVLSLIHISEPTRRA